MNNELNLLGFHDTNLSRLASRAGPISIERSSNSKTLTGFR